MNKFIVTGFILYILGQTCAWFQINSQFVWEWWEDKPLITMLIYSIPTGLCFWYGTKFMMQSTQELWSARFFAFAASYMCFPFLTWYFLKESMFTPKTLVCFFLSLVIIWIQISWK